MDGGREAKRLKRSKEMVTAGEEHGTMSSINSDSADQRGQHGDRTSSELEESEGVRTEMTSLSEADVVMEGGGSELDAALNGAASIYPSSHMTRRLESNIRLRLVGDGEEESIDLNASTRSLMERYLDYHDQHGRRYCSHYFMPNDELEQTRLYLTHQVFLHVLNGDVTTIPLKNPTKVLDIGTGTGEWAMQMGERFPNCEIVGTDLSAIQPNCPPINVFFEIEDAELPWLRQPDSLDLVHLRNMSGAFRDWRFIYEQAFECLKPGGYLEMQEFDDGSNWSRFLPAFRPDSPVHAVARDLYIGCAKAGRPRGMGHVDAKYWIEAGFVDIKTTEHVLPLTMESGSAGKLWLMTVVDGFEALCLRPLTEYMDWDPEYAKKCCEEIAYDIARIARDPERSKGLTATVRVVSGRKPTAAEWAEYEARSWQGTESASDGRTVVAGEATPGASSRSVDEADTTMQETADPSSAQESDHAEPREANANANANIPTAEVLGKLSHQAPGDVGPDAKTEESVEAMEVSESIAHSVEEPSTNIGAEEPGNSAETHDTAVAPVETTPLVATATNDSQDTIPVRDGEPGLAVPRPDEDDPICRESRADFPPPADDAMQIDTEPMAGPHHSMATAQAHPPTSQPTSPATESEVARISGIEKEEVSSLAKLPAEREAQAARPDFLLGAKAESKHAGVPFYGGDAAVPDARKGHTAIQEEQDQENRNGDKMKES